ncbi:MAG TPA: hypothetical protein VFD33_02120 [Bacillota bacterium]|nr:hypothetical protein [Bacillota bacterium]
MKKFTAVCLILVSATLPIGALSETTSDGQIDMLVDNMKSQTS